MMGRSDNSQKTPIYQTLTSFGRKMALDQIQLEGKAFPCEVVAVEGAIVTVQFLVNSPYLLPQVTIPKAESPYFRMPTQVGDLGYAAAADVRLGGVSGLGPGTADLSRPGNLTALVFVPLSNAASPPPNQTQAVAQGPGGFLGQTMDGTVKVDVTETSISLTVNGNGIIITAAGVSILGIDWLTHNHSGVESGGDVTGPIAG